MNADQLRNKVRKIVERTKSGSLSAFCERNGLTRSHVSEFLSGVAEEAPKDLLNCLKYDKVVVYKKRRNYVKGSPSNPVAADPAADSEEGQPGA